LARRREIWIDAEKEPGMVERKSPSELE